MRDCIAWQENESPTFYQDDAMGRLDSGGKRVAVYGPHGLGKTALESWCVLHFALTNDGEDWKAPMTAGAWRQLTEFLCPEIRKWARRLRWDVIGRESFADRDEMQHLSLRLTTGNAFSVASDQAALIEGAHAAHLLYVFDESKAIPVETWNAAEGAFAGGETLALAASTPGEPSGRFFEICSRKAGYEDWQVVHVTLDDAIKAGRVSEEWALQRKRQWGVDSAVYQNRVLGEFAASEEDGVIPLAWVEAANDRWHEWVAGGKYPGNFKCVGVDVGLSQDKTCIAVRVDDAIEELRRFGKEDTMSIAGRVKAILDQRMVGRAIVDVIGIGAGVVHRLREMRCRVVAFNASEKSEKQDAAGELGFLNRRAAGWWGLRERLDPQTSTICLPPDDDLTGDLCAPKWKVTSSGKIQIEDKGEVKRRLGRSPDDGDAVMMAFDPEGAVSAHTSPVILTKARAAAEPL